MGFKRLFRRNTQPTNSTSTATPPTAPTPEDDAQVDPPPYSAPQPDRNEPLQGTIPQEHVSQGFLDPNLNFTATQMEQQWRAKDKIFARAMVQFIAERFDGNLRGWGGYRYTYICEVSLLDSY
jgi:hypothetical protein